jgi:hypothetical protein
LHPAYLSLLTRSQLERVTGGITMIVRLMRMIAALLCCTLFGAPLAQAKELTPIEIQQKFEKAKIGTCVTIKELDGTEFKGQILSLGPDSVTVQPLATDGTVVLLYANLAGVQTPSHKAGWIALGVTVGVFAGFTAFGIHEYNKSVADGENQQHEFCVENHIPGC